MATFNLTWDNTAVVGSSNSIAQRASRRAKSSTNNPAASTVFDSTGFAPANDLPTTATTTTAITTVSSPLDDNTIYEFKVENICNVGGSTINSNGIRQQIRFNCLFPSIQPGADQNTQIIFGVNGVGTDIEFANITIFETVSGNVIETQTIVVTQLGQSFATFSGLTPNTSYTFTYTLQATINGILTTSPNVCGGGGTVTGGGLTACTPASNLIVTPNP